ncbi:DUF4105 domain-containing protein [Acinetobacter gerneri]|uniref:Lnb N-terminal periplasmic domain-containing protein n=1 Tax=Acinetobacter gerneri TaxID=202952 RepID=UPI002935F5EC|nr:DUF4105 domain-containing protein [Acinetobacter gerneri]MDV2440497.1 DUF4105 domain-containing protein [Acinetobacter gerneri]
MKYTALKLALLVSFISGQAFATDDISQKYSDIAAQKKLENDKTWQRLLYIDSGKKHSDVDYSGYFYAANGQKDAKAELQADIQALFQTAEPDQSIRCKFPARSQWLIQQLNIASSELPKVACPAFDEWFGQIKPYKATLIYATDFMGNPSSMFGHTLLRLDPKDQAELNLVSYAVNYAATVNESDNWSYAWKGLTGQYPGEYSLMPYYRKVKEYGDFESRDLWEYELNLSPEETAFVVKHIWEMQHVSFPYYFVSDNCAYRLLGLMDLVRPNANLAEQFKYASIPMQTIKSIKKQGLIKETVYRPALETQLLSQAKQHGNHLASAAHRLADAEPEQMPDLLKNYSAIDQSKILEMAYDDLYLQFVARRVDEKFAQPRFRNLLGLRSQIDEPKQRQEPKQPKLDPTQSHDARNWSIDVGHVQGDDYLQIGSRQAYHDLIDPQGGYRTGTQLLFLDGAIQVRDDRVKVEHLDLLTVNSLNPVTPFKTPITWGFNFAWQQEALKNGRFSSDEQHGVVSLKAQSGYTFADHERKNLCYIEAQTYLQAGNALDKGWRVGAGPTVGCQNIWTDKINSLVQVEMPYWQDASAWQIRLDTQLQYVLNQQNTLRLKWQYQEQKGTDWTNTSLGYVHYF